MTRLARYDVEDIERELGGYDAGLVRKTGWTLRQIAAAAAGVTEQELTAATASCLAAVVPITAGEGVIEYFAQSVRQYLGICGLPGIHHRGDRRGRHRRGRGRRRRDPVHGR